jgi:hypothetical protein
MSKPRDSNILGLSVRGLVVILIVLTVCAMNIMGKPVVEPLYSVVIATVSYYFGQSQKLLPR